MGFRGRHFIRVVVVAAVLAFAALVVDYPDARAQPGGRTPTPVPIDPARIEKTDLVIEPAVGGRMLFVAATVQGKFTGKIASQRVTIPRNELEAGTVYELVPILQCKKGNCNPCKPDKTCLNPMPPPPPPFLAKALLSGVVKR